MIFFFMLCQAIYSAAAFMYARESKWFKSAVCVLLFIFTCILVLNEGNRTDKCEPREKIEQISIKKVETLRNWV